MRGSGRGWQIIKPIGEEGYGHRGGMGYGDKV